MAGTPEGGRKTAKTMYTRYGPKVYERIGRAGGAVSRGGGFAYDHVGEDGLTGRERAVIAGTKGGQSSRKKA